jgi:carboxyl-terminal processing protease
MSSLSGKYYGIGAYVGQRDGQLSIIAPIASSPAEKAGLKPGDKILEINGVTTKGMNVSEAALTIQGPKGTPIKLMILREGKDEPFAIEITRDEIKIETVSSKLIDSVAYIRLSQFMSASNNELNSALKDAIDKKAKGIILDLRNNPGGLLDSAVAVASQFLAQGTVVDVVDNEGKHSPISVKHGGIATSVPLVLLVNNGSASASEVVAGALQDYGRAKLIGKQTYGKGSVQIIRNLSDGSAIHITMAKWYTPLGRPINGVGLTPDIKSDLEGDDLVNFAVDFLKK